VIICGQEFTPEIISRINQAILSEPALSRTKLSSLVCEWFDWRSANGSLKEMSCRVALLKLHEAKFIKLPESPHRIASGGTNNRIELEEIAPVKCSLLDFGAVEIVKVVGGTKLSRIWNMLMTRYHYLGSGPLCGAQIRYLIKSVRHGWVGGFAFNSASWSLQARDQWIGWDKKSRLKNLDKVVCNSRFLIIPQVKVPHLASHTLSLCLKRLVSDWYEQYNIRLALAETFVEQDRFKGTCYRASNWQNIGMTKGRGRQDQAHNAAEPIKDIYVYTLQTNAREILCEGLAKTIPCCKAPVDWAEEEFGEAKLGDKRRVERLLTIARDFYARPQANIPQASQSRAKSKAAYRFLENSNNSMEKILEPHYESTLSRLSKEKVVLAVQDTTSLNYSTPREDLGLMSYRADGGYGLLVHDTMAFNLEATPLGLLDVQVWSRDPEKYGKKHLRSKLPIEQKESNKWLTSFRKVRETQKHCPKTMLVSVGDREADIYELFELAGENPDGVQLLIRAEHNRLLADGQGHLWDYVRKQVLAGTQLVRVPRRGKLKSRDKKLEIRFANVTLRPPKKNLKPLQIQAIIAEQVDCPQEAEPLTWMLLTTLEVNSFEDAVEKIDWYCCRWGIEIYHKTLKSGCKIEERQFGKAETIQACLAIDMVVAWRIFHLTKLGRETPDVPCTAFFEEAQWKALVAYKSQNPIPSENPPTLGEAMRMVATPGGFLGRKSDGHPGTRTLWLGLQQLDALTEMWQICINKFAPHLWKPPPVPSKKCG
jgi:hypothetical protein